ncbi:MAG TPA: hypothetical protein ENH55_15270 [Aurantimonas coralicida]|uniref:Uncharacterized protein n=2 Tax=root TaxID=1 RepID=A0A9C9NJG9_9HYPH|nr:hypothetical protein [Aurantimonas coralicida]HEU02624.1 hypothetical protein [Aurantimonas coralicida]
MLTEKRKSDRAVMASRLAASAESFGAQVTIEPEGSSSISPREVFVSIRGARGLSVTIDFDGRSVQPDIHVVAWHMALDSDACLSDRFGNVNPVHFHKSTAVAEGFDALLAVIARGLIMARDGTAFCPKREAQQVAKNGTAADRAARFAVWRAELAAEGKLKACNV